jgi:hypothetical protein
VAEALSLLFPPAEWPSGTVRIQTRPDMIIVDLISDGATQRQLRVAPDCGVRAATVALVIATWTGELSSDATGTPVLRGRTAANRGEEVARNTELPAIIAPATERDLGAGVLLAMSGGVAPGFRIDFVQTRAPGGLGWEVGLSLPAQRERAAAGGSVSWTRVAANLAVNGRITLRRLAVSANAGLTGAYTLTTGHGYAINQGAQAITGGLIAGARLALPWRRLRLFTDVRAYRWLFQQTVTVDTTTGSRVATIALPSSDLQWAVGLAYVFR